MRTHQPIMTYKQARTVIVDIQFVVGNGSQYFAKEVVILFANSVFPKIFLLKSPYPFCELEQRAKNQCSFLYNKINGLKWTDGYIEYNRVTEILQQIKDFVIVVKGNDKKNFISKYIPFASIIDLDIGCSLKNLKNYDQNCIIHKSYFQRCGVNNVFKLLIFMEKHNLFK